MAEKFKKSRKELDKIWKKGQEAKDEYQGFKPEDGRYPVTLVGAKLGESKSSGRQQIAWKILFRNKDYKGKELTYYNGLDTEQSAAFAIRAIESWGFEAPESTADLEALLKKIAKKKPNAWVRTKEKDDFINVYVDKLIDEDDMDDLEDPEEDDDEDEDSEDEDDEEEDEDEEDDDEDEDSDDDEESEDEDDEEDEDDDKKKKKKKKSSKVTKEEDEDDEEDDEDEESEDDEEDEDSDEDDEDEEETLEIDKGMKVKCVDDKGKKIGVGKILKINTEKETVTVKIDGEKHVVKFTNLRAVK